MAVEYRSTDEYYSFLLYIFSKLGSIFHILVDNEQLKVVSEDSSLSSKSGTIEFVLIDTSKKRKRKLVNGFFWKQNGDENKLNIFGPNQSYFTKRNFTKVENSESNDRKPTNFKCWEYALFNSNSNNQFHYILRHYLKDMSQNLKYITKHIKITLISKCKYISTVNDYIISLGDFQTIDSIYNFAKDYNLIHQHFLDFNDGKSNTLNLINNNF